MHWIDAVLADPGPLPAGVSHGSAFSTQWVDTQECEYDLVGQ